MLPYNLGKDLDPKEDPDPDPKVTDFHLMESDPDP
jgi:hypothetical protein